MGTDISQQRVTETWTGRLACVLLAVVWFVSMGVADSNAYSYVPLLAGLMLAVLLTLSAMIRGAKVVRMSLTGWLSLGAGAYFLVRCLCSFSVVESWREASVILGCGVFYVAGIYAAQGRTLRPVIWVLVVAALLNLLYFGLMRGTDVPMEWAGRPAVGPCSMNRRPITLFAYKNHASAFLLMIGVLLCCAAVWSRIKVGKCALLCAVGAGCMWCSLECNSRVPYLLGPVMFVVWGGLWGILKMYANEKIGLSGILGASLLLGVLILSVCVAVYERGLVFLVEEINTHGRYAMWYDICRLLPDTPLCGYGAMGVQWLLLTRTHRMNTFTGMLNYAHNEYLQAWVDYGVFGFLLLVLIVGVHLCRGMLVMAEDSVSMRRRVMTALSLLCVIGWCVSSLSDFYWHHFSIATMTAFAVGGMASPYPRRNVHKGIHRNVVSQGKIGKGVLSLAGTLVGGCCAWLSFNSLPAWMAQWEYNRLSQQGADSNGEKRHAMIARLMPSYPATALMDQYFRVSRSTDNWQQEVALLRMALRGNPYQTNTAVMLAELLSRHGRYEEAEAVYRRYYSGDGPNDTSLGDWAKMYVLNLLRYGQSCWVAGNAAKGYSLMRYGLAILEHQKKIWVVDMNVRPDKYVWQVNGKYMPDWEEYIKARREDVRMMQMLKVEPDDSWQKPDSSGKPALYRRYGASESLEMADSAAPAPAAVKKE